MLWLIICLALISLLGVILTLYDKSAARRGAWRIPESALFLTGALGGAFAMFLCMQLIRHKTAHARFMLGFPLMILCHAALLYYLLFVLRVFGEL